MTRRTLGFAALAISILAGIALIAGIALESPCLIVANAALVAINVGIAVVNLKAQRHD